MGKQWKQWQTIFWGSKITADGDCGHEIKRCLLLGRKVMTNLDSILKGRDVTLPTKVHLVKAMVFPIVVYVYESWTIKKAEYRRTDAFELWSWRRLLRVPWMQGDPTSPSLRKSVLNIHWKDWCSSWNSNTLSLVLMQRTDSFEKTLMLGKIESRRRRGRQRMASLTRRTWVWMDSRSGDGQEGLACCSQWGCKESDTTEWLNWTELRLKGKSAGSRSCFLGRFSLFLKTDDSAIPFFSASECCYTKMWCLELL